MATSLITQDDFQTVKLCDYGCGELGMYTFRNLKVCCKRNVCQCPKVRQKNSDRLRQKYEENLDNRQRGFTKESIQKSHSKRELNLKSKPFHQWGLKLRYRQIFEEQEGKCLICKISEWRSLPIKLQLDHINGDSLDNRRENLRLLCPNCHSQTPTYCGLNKSTGVKRVPDSELVQAYSETGNIRQALLQVGLSPRGGNYARMYKVLSALKET